MIGQWAAQATQNVVQGLFIVPANRLNCAIGTMALGSAIPQALGHYYRRSRGPFF